MEASLKPLILCFIALVVAVGVDRLLLWMESRHWIYYRRTKKNTGGGAIAGAMLEAQKAFEPGVAKAAEERQEITRKDDGSGDPPEPGEAPVDGDVDVREP
jgi:hypothetical protein